MSVQKRLSVFLVIALLSNLFILYNPGKIAAEEQGAEDYVEEFAAEPSVASAVYGYSLGNFETPEDKWDYSFGDQPSVVGSLEFKETGDAYEGSFVGRLSGDFRNTTADKPAFVAMRKNLDEIDVRALSFRIRTSDVRSLAIRSTDSTGQTFQQRITLQETAGWQEVVVPALTASLYWGGANDGVWHEPARSVAILFDRASIPGAAKLGSIDVDQVEAQLGDWLPELKIRQNALGNVFLDNEPASFRIATKYPQFQWSVYDLYGRAVDEGVGQSPGGEGTVQLNGAEPGYYVLHVTVQRPGSDPATLRTPFAVLTDYDWSQVDDSPFSIAAHLHRTSLGWSEDLPRLIRLMGAQSARGGMEWTIEKTKGVYTYTPQPESFMQRLEAEGLKGMFVAGYNNPLYDNNATPYTNEGREGFANYVNDYVTRYKDRLNAVEVYNEFNGGFGQRGNSPANSQPSYYYELLKKTYETVKANHPEFTVSGMVTAGIPMSWMESVFQLGGLNYLDVVSVHPYRYGRTPVEARAPEGMEEELDALKTLIRSYNGGELKPIWITEIGWPTHQSATGTDEKTQADYLVRAYTVALANGVEKMVWYNLMNDGLQTDYNEHNFGLIRFKDDPLGAYTPKPAYAAYAAMTRELTGAEFEQREDYGPDIRSYLFRNNGEPTRVLWALANTIVAVRTDAPITVTDLTGRSETYEPLNGKVYLSLTGEPQYVKGEIVGIAADDAFELEGESAVAGEPASVKVKLRNDTSAALSLALEVDGQQHSLAASPGATSELILLAETSGEGARPVLIEVREGGRKVGKLRLDVVASAAKAVTIRPLLESDGAAYAKSLGIRIENYNSARTLEAGPIQWAIGSQSGTYSEPVSVPPLGERTIEIPLPGTLTEGTEYAASVRVPFVGLDTFEYSGKLSFIPIVPYSVAVNGQIEPELEAMSPTIDLAKGTVKVTNYRGADDLSGRVWLHYDRDHLYVTAKIKDDVHSSAAKGADIWNNDSIQFAFSDGIPGENPSWYEYGISATPDGAQVYRWSAAGGNAVGAVNNAQAVVSRAEAEKTTVYKLALPWTELAPVKAGRGEAMSFSLLVNDNDGSGRRGWIEWASGIGSEKRPSLFRSMQWIVPPGEPELYIEGVADGESYLDSVTPVVRLEDESGGWRIASMTLDGETWPEGTAVTTKGEHTLAVRAESANGVPIERSVSFTLVHGTSVETVSAAARYGGVALLKAVLRDSGGQPLAGASVGFTVNGVQAGEAKTDAQGRASLRYAVEIGVDPGEDSRTLEVKALYAGSSASFLRGSEGIGALTVTKAEAVVRYTGTIKAQANKNASLSVQATRKESGGKGTLAGLPIAFELSAIQPDGTSKPYRPQDGPIVVMTGANGKASATVKLPAGLYEVTAKLAANGYYEEAAASAHLAVYDPRAGSLRLNGHFELNGSSSFWGDKAKKIHLNVGSNGARIQATPKGKDWTLKKTDWTITKQGSAYWQGTTTSGGTSYTVRITVQEGSRGKAYVSLLVWKGKDTVQTPVFQKLNVELKGSFRVVR
ncbi:hypothetical protein J4772_05130 [Cohnella sp. LGH]|uniref:sugar-binding protein n=1 Tax=Cohnella sp. LGH TaxID=1619153 RepID=UPI001AD9AA80|nr:sugar-binding protein [Cohnella sp. LGH]QTH43804.1 hypothetical protein J4772_05130 [Cohnella sp. LGH]